MRQTFLLMIVIIAFLSCNSQYAGKDTYNDKYVVGQIPELTSFETYNEFDKRIQDDTSLAKQVGFRKNRSRIFMQSYSNGKQSTQDSSLYKGMPMPCDCMFENDTLKVKAGIGFFGGMGFEIKIFQKVFQSNYFLYTVDVNSYKYNLSEKDFRDNLYMRSKFQSLVLSEQPTFKAGQQLTGYLTFTSPTWYENSFGDNIDTNFIKGKLYFTCLTR